MCFGSGSSCPGLSSGHSQLFNLLFSWTLKSWECPGDDASAVVQGIGLDKLCFYFYIFVFPWFLPIILIILPIILFILSIVLTIFCTSSLRKNLELSRVYFSYQTKIFCNALLQLCWILQKTIALTAICYWLINCLICQSYIISYHNNSPKINNILC